jgi:hypothetical protein
LSLIGHEPADFERVVAICLVVGIDGLESGCDLAKARAASVKGEQQQVGKPSVEVGKQHAACCTERSLLIEEREGDDDRLGGSDRGKRGDGPGRGGRDGGFIAISPLWSHEVRRDYAGYGREGRRARNKFDSNEDLA